MRPAPPHTVSPDPRFAITGSPGLPAWLRRQDIALALTSRQAGRLLFIGVTDTGRLSASTRRYDLASGLCIHDESLYLSTRYQLWRFENVLAEGHTFKGRDRLYVPREAVTTGNLGTRDPALGDAGELYFITTLYNCLAAASDRYSFRPVWRPPFISDLSPGDRCHLNGLALRHGAPAYATCCSASDTISGWQQDRHHGGLLLHIPDSEVVATGLCLPHAPRIFRNRLWLLNAGSGEFGVVEPETGRFEPVAFCPGFPRGLDFTGDTAVIGVSNPRGGQPFQGLPRTARFAGNRRPFCGLLFVDLTTGAPVHWLRMEGPITELSDVRVLDEARHPMAMGVSTDELHRFASVGTEQATEAAFFWQ